MGGLPTGPSHDATIETSFRPALRILIASTLYELFNNLSLLHAGDILTLAAALVMLIVITRIVAMTFLKFVARHDFTSFSLFCIGRGLLASA